MKKTILLAAVFLAAAAVSVSAADGKALWDKDCAKCHGADGKGKTKMGEKLGAKDYSDPKVQEKVTDEVVAKSLKEGVKDGAKTLMKPFPEYTDADVKAVTAHLRTLKK